jgi:hypothetical protein
VLDVDELYHAEGKDRELDEDLQIRDRRPLLLVEVKGVGGRPSDDECLQVRKHFADRMKQVGHTQVAGLTIINHERSLPALDRNPSPFRDKIVSAAEHGDVGLLTTFDLWRLARSFVLNNWRHADVADLFYRVGRICPVPNHYTPVGVVERFIENAAGGGVSVAGINLDRRVCKGDRIAFELPTLFVEQEVTSLQLDRRDVDCAEPGSLAGISTGYARADLRMGTPVYLVSAPTG